MREFGLSAYGQVFNLTFIIIMRILDNELCFGCHFVQLNIVLFFNMLKSIFFTCMCVNTRECFIG